MDIHKEIHGGPPTEQMKGASLLTAGASMETFSLLRCNVLVQMERNQWEHWSVAGLPVSFNNAIVVILKCVGFTDFYSSYE